jgi:CRP-like cAMP-binding protein
MPAQPVEKNAFLARLSASDFALLRPHLVSFEMRLDDYLHYLGDRIEEVVFPRSGLISLSIPVRDGTGAAILAGREGIIGGFAAVAAAPATCDAEVCIGGTALRMSATVFRHALEQSSSIRRLAAQFDIAMLAHAQQTATRRIPSRHASAGCFLKLTIIMSSAECRSLKRPSVVCSACGERLLRWWPSGWKSPE